MEQDLEVETVKLKPPQRWKIETNNDEEGRTQPAAHAEGRGKLLRRGSLRRVWHQRERWEDIEPKTFSVHTRTVSGTQTERISSEAPS
jgi:hypothetical protein